MEHDELVPVYVVSNPAQAELIKNQLNDEGIRCFISGENQAGLVGLMGLEIRIFVAAEDADRAARVLQTRGKDLSPEGDA
jgi:hypothetical protein